MSIADGQTSPGPLANMRTATTTNLRIGLRGDGTFAYVGDMAEHIVY